MTVCLHYKCINNLYNKKHEREIEVHDKYTETLMNSLELEKEKDLRGLQLIINRYEELLNPSTKKVVQPPKEVAVNPRPLKKPKTPSSSVPRLCLGQINVKQYLKPLRTSGRQKTMRKTKTNEI